MEGFLRRCITLSSSGTLWYDFFFGLLPPLDFCLIHEARLGLGLGLVGIRNGTWRSINCKYYSLLS